MSMISQIFKKYSVNLCFNINSNSENESQQAQATEIILNAIIAKSDLCIGVTLFEFCDEWWKAGNPNQQDPGGFSNAIPYDNFANEHIQQIIAIAPRTECLETPIHNPTKEVHNTDWGSTWTNTKIEVDESRQID